jgi:hypothetical protein
MKTGGVADICVSSFRVGWTIVVRLSLGNFSEINFHDAGKCANLLKKPVF